MKVVHVLGYLAERYGGPPGMALNLGQALQKLGVDVSWWATATDAEIVEMAILGPDVHLYPAHFPRSWYYSPDFRHALAEYVEEADILHLHQVWDYPLYAAAQLARKHDKPCVVTPHGIFNQSWRYNSLKKRLYLHFLARPFLQRSACIHAITSPELSGFSQADLQAPRVVIPNGVAIDHFRDLPHPSAADEEWPELSGRPVALFLGRLSAEKGLDLLIRAWRDVSARYPAARLMIAGPDHGGYRATVEAAISEKSLAQSILLPGMLQGRRKLAALSRADIYVQPSYSEGFSMAVLEAMAAGKPCLITEGCNFPQVAEVGAGKIVPAETGAIATGLIDLLSLSPAEREAMGARGKQLVFEQYTWQIAAEKMLTVYQRILAGEPIPLYPDSASAMAQ